MSSQHLQKAAASGAVMVGINSYVMRDNDSSSALSKEQLKRGASQALVSYFANDIQRMAETWFPFLTQYTGAYSKEVWSGIVYAIVIRLLERDSSFKLQKKDFVRIAKSIASEYVATKALDKFVMQ